jgi:hypothetical protein
MAGKASSTQLPLYQNGYVRENWEEWLEVLVVEGRDFYIGRMGWEDIHLEVD